MAIRSKELKAMRLWAVATGLAFLLSSVALTAATSSRQTPSAAGNWQIAFRGESRTDGAPAAALGMLALHDTVVIVTSDDRPIRRHVLIGTFRVDFAPLRVEMPIGTGVVGAVEARSRFWARLGEGADRGEIELDGNFAGDSVVGRWVKVFHRKAPLRMGQFVMHRVRN